MLELRSDLQKLMPYGGSSGTNGSDETGADPASAEDVVEPSDQEASSAQEEPEGWDDDHAWKKLLAQTLWTDKELEEINYTLKCRRPQVLLAGPPWYRQDPSSQASCAFLGQRQQRSCASSSVSS